MLGSTVFMSFIFISKLDLLAIEATRASLLMKQ